MQSTEGGGLTLEVVEVRLRFGSLFHLVCGNGDPAQVEELGCAVTRAGAKELTL